MKVQGKVGSVAERKERAVTKKIWVGQREETRLVKLPRKYVQSKQRNGKRVVKMVITINIYAVKCEL